MVSAGHALTMHGLTGGRYVFGSGRGIEVLQRAHGIFAADEQTLGLLRVCSYRVEQLSGFGLGAVGPITQISHLECPQR